MILKYNLSSQISDSEVTDVKLVLPNTITLATDNKYSFTAVNITKNSPFTITIEDTYQVRYLVVYSDQSFTICINDGQELITRTHVVDYGVNRTGFNNVSKINTIKITNPIGASGPIGSQFSNPTTIEVRYLLVLEKI